MTQHLQPLRKVFLDMIFPSRWSNARYLYLGQYQPTVGVKEDFNSHSLQRFQFFEFFEGSNPKFVVRGGSMDRFAVLSQIHQAESVFLVIIEKRGNSAGDDPCPVDENVLRGVFVDSSQADKLFHDLRVAESDNSDADADSYERRSSSEVLKSLWWQDYGPGYCKNSNWAYDLNLQIVRATGPDAVNLILSEGITWEENLVVAIQPSLPQPDQL